MGRGAPGRVIQAKGVDEPFLCSNVEVANPDAPNMNDWIYRCRFLWLGQIELRLSHAGAMRFTAGGYYTLREILEAGGLSPE